MLFTFDKLTEVDAETAEQLTLVAGVVALIVIVCAEAEQAPTIKASPVKRKRILFRMKWSLSCQISLFIKQDLPKRNEIRTSIKLLDKRFDK
jgi:hypothetical protein